MRSLPRELFAVVLAVLLASLSGCGGSDTAPSMRPAYLAPGGAKACKVEYKVESAWSSGAQVSVTVTNLGADDITGWIVAWTFPGDQAVTSCSNARCTQDKGSPSVSAQNPLSYNTSIGKEGGTVSFSFGLTYARSNTSPDHFSLNGTACNGGAPVSLAYRMVHLQAVNRDLYPGGVADFNDDGLLDLAFASYNGSAKAVIMFGDGAGRFPTVSEIETGAVNSPWLVTEDFNLDGHADLALAKPYSDTPGVQLLLGRGNGTFGDASALATGGSHPGILKVADLNNDGAPDIVAGMHEDKKLQVMLNDGSGHFAAEGRSPLDGPCGNWAILDYDRDGAYDLVFGCADGLYLTPNKGDGHFSALTTTKVLSTGSIWIADLNGDNLLDLVAQTSSTTLSPYIQKTSSSFSQGASYSLDGPVGATTVLHDLDLDGVPDLIASTRDPAHYDTVSIFLASGDGGFEAARKVDVRGELFSPPLVADLDRDGIPDLIYVDWAIRDGQTGNLTLLLSTKAP